MTSVLPPLLENLQETLDTLPWPTRVAKAISDTLMSYGWLLAIAGAIALVVGVGFVLRSDRGKAFWHRTLLRLPLIGPDGDQARGLANRHDHRHALAQRRGIDPGGRIGRAIDRQCHLQGCLA